jgi:hypothetical protein
MFYAIPCCHAAQAVCAWTPDEDAAVMARLASSCGAVEA